MIWCSSGDSNPGRCRLRQRSLRQIEKFCCAKLRVSGVLGSRKNERSSCPGWGNCFFGAVSGDSNPVTAAMPRSHFIRFAQKRFAFGVRGSRFEVSKKRQTGLRPVCLFLVLQRGFEPRDLGDAAITFIRFAQKRFAFGVRGSNGQNREKKNRPRKGGTSKGSCLPSAFGE